MKNIVLKMVLSEIYKLFKLEDYGLLGIFCFINYIKFKG